LKGRPQAGELSFVRYGIGRLLTVPDANAADPLSTIVREHPDLVRQELISFYRSDPKWRKAFAGQISTALHEFERQVAQQSPGETQA
jgi:hypothetical protein